MNLNTNNLCEDWGWFIDIETNDSNILLEPCKSIKKINIKFNKLQTIEEDEYDYYEKYYNNPEEKYDKIENENKKSTEPTNVIVNVGSTTLLTALLTYVIFFIL